MHFWGINILFRQNAVASTIFLAPSPVWHPPKLFIALIAASSRTVCRLKDTVLQHVCWVIDERQVNQLLHWTLSSDVFHRKCCHLLVCSYHGRPHKFFQGGQRRNFAYHFPVADDAIQMDVHKTNALPFLPH